MAVRLCERSAPALRWYMQRNPTYVLSGACIACGARMLLVPAESPPAGDFSLILLTLAVLQAYEIGVSAVLLWLHRKGFAPEDQPSVTIVAAVFWTGPLIATMEMTAVDAQLGAALALSACVIAIGELRAVARRIGWRLSPWTHAVATACLLLVAAGQPLLKVESAAGGSREVLLYGFWWVLAAIIVVGVPGLRRKADTRVDAGIMTAAVGAAVLHLVAMNHAFCGHAKAFYAAPVLAAAAAGGLLVLRRGERGPHAWLLVLCFWMPAIGIYLSIARFDSAFPLAALPLPLRDPLLVGLVLAAGAWWCGYVRHRWPSLLHAAVLASAFAIERAIFSEVLRGAMPLVPLSWESLTDLQRGVVIATVAWYLFALAWWLRSRELLAIGLVIHQFGVAACIPWGWKAAGLALVLTWGWTVLLVIHAAVERPGLKTRLLPIVVLVIASWAFCRDPQLARYAQAHLALMVAAFAVAGWFQSWTRYLPTAIAIAAASASPVIFRGIRDTTHGPAMSVISAGFLLLGGGMWVSARKQRMLRAWPISSARDETAGGDPGDPADANPPVG